MISGYTLRDGSNGSTAITVRQVLPAWARRFQNRPTLTSSQYGPAVNATYALGRYIEDFEYRGDLGQTQGVDFDLNEYNVRWCVTPEYPSGTYAYFTPIKADGTPFYPYTTGRQYFGSPTGGATYAVAASTDDTTYTTRATGLVATSPTRATTYAALGTSDTEYTRVTRTALAGYDTNGFSAATVAQTATASFDTGPLQPAASFSTFRTTHFTNAELRDPTVSGPDADADADGLPNLLEYAFDLDPRAPNAARAISADLVSDRLELSYPRRPPSAHLHEPQRQLPRKRHHGDLSEHPKNELVRRTRFVSRDLARLIIFDDIEVF